MGYLVTGKSAFFQTPLLLGTMKKTAPVSLEHQFCQRKKSSTGGTVPEQFLKESLSRILFDVP